MKILKSFKSTECEWELFNANDKVSVIPKYVNELFSHEFVATVIDKNAICVIVEDQDGECFTVDPDQLKLIKE
jgi:hypothetical protein